MMRWKSRAWAGTLLLVTFLFATPSSAQDAQQRQAAAAAYDRGSAAFLAEDFPTAARWFEMANDLAPAPTALLQALRAHRRAGNELRAATIALRLTLDGAEGSVGAAATDTLAELEPQFVRVDVSCDAECAVELDGALTGQMSFFAEPDVEHTVAAGFGTGTPSETFTGTSGQRVELSFEAPPAPVAERSRRRDVDLANPPAPEPIDDSGGIHPALFVTSLVLTLGAGATLVWSGVDVLNDNDEYEQEARLGNIDRARELLANGQKEEQRTNILIGVTAGLGALTVLFAILTDWDGAPDEGGIAVQLGPSGAGIAGTF